jgi:Transposase, Mutator family
VAIGHPWPRAPLSPFHKDLGQAIGLRSAEVLQLRVILYDALASRRCARTIRSGAFCATSGALAEAVDVGVILENLRGLRLSRAAELVEMAVEETLAYYAFPEEHWRRIRTNNPLEPARDPPAHPRRGRVSSRSIGAQPRRREAAPHRRHGMVDQEISQYRVAEGSADERCHHRVSQGRAPLSQTERSR